MSNMDAATKYLQEELKKAEKRFQILLVAMGIVLVVIVGYFQWIKSETAEILTPDSLSDFLVNEVRRGLPVASASLRDAINEQAPEVVRFMVGHVIDGVFPIVREGVEKGLKEYSRDLTTYGVDAAMIAFEEVVGAHAKDLGTGTEIDTDTLAMRLSDQLQIELDKRIVDDNGETLQDKLDASAVALRRIDDKLKQLAAGRNLSRQEELGKRLITTWWTFLERNREDLPAGQALAEEPAPAGSAKKAWSPKARTVPAAP